jgi:protein involved in polysaccharide export with SLBB domain
MRYALTLALVLLVVTPAVAQEDNSVVKAGRYIRMMFLQPGGPPLNTAYVLVEENGNVELEKVFKGLGRVKLSGLSIEQATAVLSDRLKRQDRTLVGAPEVIDRSQLDDLLKKEQESEKKLSRRVEIGVAYLGMLRLSLEKIPEDDPKQLQAVKPGSVIHITFKNLIPTAPLGIGKDYLVGDDGPFELKLGAQSFGRVELVGKTSQEAEAAITKHLKSDHPAAEAELRLFDVARVKSTLARSEKQVGAMMSQLGVLRKNIETLKRALPFN